ncbi:putative RNA-directed DNA polymerase from transposon X-element [Frankliniella fusca]|uniref:RNA-directed DNA polymerase from transposon X-element n=1 Tax=Frankliniella fusca TaxID=407009 RepID=A0AAE1LTP4_9NEOP|nr:putative RNA-directed DNA polymerase from transposon X-element [Frankliniella fusca]
MGVLKVISLNANGLKPRLPFLEDILSHTQADVLLVQETNLGPKTRANISGFRHYRTDRGEGRRGLSTFVKEGLRHAQLPPPARVPFEVQTTEVDLPGGPLLLLNTYKTPRPDTFEGPSLDRLLAIAPRVLIVGDLNCRHTAWGCRSNNTAGNQLYAHLAQRDCAIIAPDEPTRTDPRDGGQSTLDIGIVHCLEYLVTAETLGCVGSDHAPVLFTVHTTPTYNEAPRRLNYNRARWPTFQQHLNTNLVIKRFNSEAEVDEGVTTLTITIQKAMEKAIPRSKGTRKPNTLPPHIEVIKRDKNAARRRWIRTRDPEDRDEHNQLKHAMKEAMTAWRDQQWQHTMQECSEDHTRVWKIGRALKGWSGTVQPLTTATGMATSAQARAEAISEHFEKVHTANDHMAEPQHTQQTQDHNNPLISGLGQYSPETAPYRMKHKMPLHLLFQQNA